MTSMNLINSQNLQCHESFIIVIQIYYIFHLALQVYYEFLHFRGVSIMTLFVGMNLISELLA